jgi:hypothetical protein
VHLVEYDLIPLGFRPGRLDLIERERRVERIEVGWPGTDTGLAERLEVLDERLWRDDMGRAWSAVGIRSERQLASGQRKRRKTHR